ncbi:uncharacterized protein DUF4440 [Diaminobutyricimonas aerilata]|uniref:Uncharacterized protein DUF4440 n=1 Tax=Diaminobutyricimonas aerilata TaxID=1162967 RepID=A0A2M9CNT1_9MICO|nr:nuclear transport factor 2 family protein [Diaminobutyricimonas aerilata]PJJ73528.1 uncharacterized protein DUF4440 [Diaminobutyricimonas aerilata]
MTVITDDLPARLLHEEQMGWKAIAAGRGGAHYASAMTPDAVMVVPGAVIDRDGIAAALDGSTWDEWELHEPRIVRVGDKGAVLVYRAVARRGDTRVELMMSTTYLWRDGRWKVALHQQTPV